MFAKDPPALTWYALLSSASSRCARSSTVMILCIKNIALIGTEPYQSPKYYQLPH